MDSHRLGSWLLPLFHVALRTGHQLGKIEKVATLLDIEPVVGCK